jgi:outer membrane receptor protein involved in Fe transport
MTLRNILLGATMLCAATTPAYAFAQDADVSADTATTNDEAEYGNEIIVTATGRSQIAQDVPIALSVVGGEQLANAGISDIRGLRQVAPSLQVTTGQSSATGVVLRIRGIGTAGDNPGFEPAVGVFIDGVLRARAGVALADLPPIDRVEVLRGPQGTLFGRNTSAGALNIITQKPSFDLGGYAELSYGNYDEIEAKAGITGGLSEAVAVRLDGGYHKRDGYIKDANSDRRFNDVDRWFVRGQALFEKDDISLRIIGDYAKTDEQCCGAINTNSGFLIAPNPADINTVLGFAASNVIQAFSANPLLGGAVGRVGIVRPFDAKSRTMATSPNRDLSEKVKEWGVSGELNWNLGDVTLASITAYRDWKALRNQDIDFSGLDRAYRDGYRTGLTDFTQEIRFNGSAFDGGLDWLVGGFYLNEKTTLTDRVRFGTQADQFVDGMFNALTAGQPGLPAQGLQLYGTLGPLVPVYGGVPLPRTPDGGGQVADQYSVKTEAFALFTHNIVNFTDQLSLTLGLRYNHENKDIKANLNSVVPACSFLQSPGAAAYRAGLGARFPLVYLYACNPTVNSEFNGNYTGDRSESEFTGTAKLSFKVTDDVLLYGGYDRGYKSGGYNLDRGSFDSVLLGGNGAQITDLEFGNETADVFEVGVKSNFGHAFQVNASLFHSTFKGYQNNAFEGTRFVVRNFDKVISQGVELDTIIRPVSDLTFQFGYTYLDTEVKDPLAGSDNGKPLTNSPRHVITSAMTWTPQLSSSVGGLVHIDARTNSDSNTLNSPLGVPFTKNDGYSIVNARVGLNFNDNKFGIEAYVENLFNKYYNITSFPVPEQGTSFAVYPAPPRFYGVKLRASF